MDYTQALHMQPSNPEALWHRGSLSAALSRPQAALDDFSRAIAQDRTAANCFDARWSLLEPCISCRLTFGVLVKGVMGGAAAHHHQGLSRAAPCRSRYCLLQSNLWSPPLNPDPSTLSCVACRGLVLQGLGRLPAALADFEAALALEPGNLAFVGHRGACLRAAGQLGASAADLERVLSAHPLDVAALSNRGCAALISHCMRKKQTRVARALPARLGGRLV